MSSPGYDDEVKEDSPWLYPLVILAITLILSGGVSYYYFGPSLSDFRGDTPEASARTTPIHMQIGSTNFVIPENFTQYPRARRGGIRDSVALYAMLPNLEPYSVRYDQYFFENNVDNPVVYFQIEIARLPMSESERLELIYRERLEEGLGTEIDNGLMQHNFANDSGYDDQELFVATKEDGTTVVILCTEFSNMVPSPNCRREMDIGNDLIMSYRFKRHHLDQWQDIDRGLLGLVASFRVPSN